MTPSMPTSRIRKALVVLALFIAAIVSLVGPTHALSRLQGGWTQVTATFRWAATETARSKSEETGAETSNGASRDVPPAGAQNRVEPSGEAPAAANAGTTNSSGDNGPLTQGEAADTDAATSATSPLTLGGAGQPTGAADGIRRPDLMARLNADGQGAGAAGGFGRRAPSDGEPSGSGSVSGEPGTSSRTGDRLDGVGPVAGVDSPGPAELAPVLPPAETPPTDETPGDRNRNDRGVDGGPPDPLPTLRSEEHTSELQSRLHLVCRLLLE